MPAKIRVRKDGESASNSKLVNTVMSKELKDKLLEIAEKKYRIPGNMAHAIRLMIEDTWEGMNAGK